MAKKVHIGVYRNPSARRVDIYVTKDTNSNNITHALPLEYGEPDDRDDANLDIQPTFSLEYETAELLMNQLWAAGIRPEADVGTQSMIKVTQAHLEDMRRLVFDTPK